MSKKKYFDLYDDYPYDPTKHNQEGYDLTGYYRDRYNSQGYDEYGYDAHGYDRDGYDQFNFNQDGYGRDGYDHYGFNRNGYDQYGYDEEGYDIDGYDKEGRMNEIIVETTNYSSLDSLEINNVKVINLKGKTLMSALEMNSIIEFVIRSKNLIECNLINLNKKPEVKSIIFSSDIIPMMQQNKYVAKAFNYIVEKSTLKHEDYARPPIEDHHFLRYLLPNKNHVDQMLGHLSKDCQNNANLWCASIIKSQFSWLLICHDIVTNGGDFKDFPIEVMCHILSYVPAETIEY